MPAVNAILSGAEAALGILQLMAATNSVSVLNSGFQPVLQFVRPMKASVREISRTLDHPIENGQIISDYSIILPIEIELQGLVMAQFYRGTYQEIRGLWLTKQLLTVQTKANNYPNMIIAEMPHEERPEMFDALSITVKFRQVQVVSSSTVYAPANPTQVNTQSAGQQSPTTVSTAGYTPQVQQQVTAAFGGGNAGSGVTAGW